MRRKYKPNLDTNSEFELDLAPLLAVMVKLVPVLLLSSAFVQMNMIETELPQVVQEALKEDPKKIKTTITLSIENNLNVEITTQTGEASNKIVINSSGKNLNTSELHKELIKLKQKYPEVFKIDLRPNGSVPYDLIVQIMDEARKSRDPNIMFPIFDKAKNETTQTPYMFPEVIFVNTTEG